ncbi:MAG TPA: hypothetical protein VJU86_06440 [Pyrinomonadaceae bacterium]|nr:hypothetical protein [Pyrinomonadaceae bacterium]
MKMVLLVTTISLFALLSMGSRNACSSAQGHSDSLPARLVVIKGKATIINFPGRENMPATSNTLIFQKAGCDSCFVGANADSEGNYRILVSDGKYKIIVRNPSNPGPDWLAPNQERFVDTGSENSPNSEITFDIKIMLPKE